MDRPAPDSEDLKICSCADCGCDLLGASSYDWWLLLSAAEKALYPPMSRRVASRPYCPACLQPKGPPKAPRGRRKGVAPGDDASDYQGKAIRDMEDGEGS